MSASLLSVAAAGLMLLAADDPSKKDLEKLQGAWKVQTVQTGGKDVDADDIAGAVLTIDGNKFTLVKEGKTIDQGTFTLDAGKKPPTVDPQSSKDGAKPIPAVYQLDGDVFKEAFLLDGSARPTEVVSKEGSPVVVVIFKRQKK